MTNQGGKGNPQFTFIDQVDTRWMERAACRGITDIDWFDTDCGLQAAATICYSCPVASRCLDYAIDLEIEDGVWAGLWGDQLKAMMAARRRHTLTP